MPRRRTEPDPADARPPLEQYLAALEQLYALRREPEASSRETGKLETRLAALRKLMAPTERLRADARERETNDAFRAWLGEQPAKRPASARVGRDETTGARKRPLRTDAPPGAEAKVDVMEERRRRGQNLTDPADAGEPLDGGLRSVATRNGARTGGGSGAAVVDGQGNVIRTFVAPLAMRLRRLRDAAGLSKKALARKAGLSLRCVTLLESDRRRTPRVDTLQALADALNTTMDALVGRAESRKST